MSKLFNFTTNRQGLIVYGGEASSDFGIVVAQAPTFDKPKRKETNYTVPGRNGTVLFQQDAFDDVTRSYSVWLTKRADMDYVETINAFSAWLNSKKGYQRLEDSFEPEVFRLAHYQSGQDIENNLMQYGKATISFTCRPERFYKSGEEEVEITNVSAIENPTRFIAKPLIHIEVASTETVTVSIGGEGITAEVDDYINIDCERMNAYRLDGENMNTEIGGTFPTLKPGNNGIAITGTVTKVTIIPRFFAI